MRSRTVSRIFTTSLLLNLSLVTIGCDDGSAVDDEGSGDSGKADDLDEPAPYEELLPCEDDSDVGCLRHGDGNWKPPEYLNPTWSRATLQQWNHQTQGTQMIPLSWLLALEAPDEGPFDFRKEAFLDDAHVQKYGFLPDHDRTWNPFELPVGLSVHGDVTMTQAPDGTLQENAFFGYTCAACHTGSMTFDGTEYRIAGGGGKQDMSGFNQALLTTLAGTVTRNLPDVPFVDVPFISDKHDRFIERVQALQDRLYGVHQEQEDIDAQLKRFGLFEKLIPLARENRKLRPTEHGPGRLDALGNGGNTMFSKYLERFHGKDGFDAQANLAVLDGMVALPPVYDAPKWDWAQYTHSIRQAFGRNLAEAIAVNSPTDPETLETSASAEGLAWIEEQLRYLEGPAYRQDIFGPIDPELAAQGEALFNDIEQHPDVACARCHAPKEEFVPGGEWKLKVLPLGVIGTDPETVLNFAERTVELPQEIVDSLQLDGRTQLAGIALNTLVTAVGEQLFDQLGWGSYEGSVERCQDPATWRSDPACSATLGRSNLFRLWVETDLEQTAPGRDPVVFAPEEGFDRGDPRCADLTDAQCAELYEQTGWLVYRARPLEGMWYTAPFLHNDSVPNLCALLGDPEERPNEFYVGATEFDPECLGYPSDRRSKMPDGRTRAAKRSVSDSGNSNRGHEFSDAYTGRPENGVIGRALSDQEIRAIVEYVKSMKPLAPGF